MRTARSGSSFPASSRISRRRRPSTHSITMEDALAVNVIERVADIRADANRALGLELPGFVEDIAQAASFHPFHHHGYAFRIVDLQHFHDAGMIELPADIRLPLKAAVENHVGFHLGEGDFDGHRRARLKVCSSE